MNMASTSWPVRDRPPERGQTVFSDDRVLWGVGLPRLLHLSPVAGVGVDVLLLVDGEHVDLHVVQDPNAFRWRLLFIFRLQGGLPLLGLSLPDILGSTSVRYRST